MVGSMKLMKGEVDTFEVTVYQSDVSNSTTICEDVDPVILMKWFESYLGIIARIIVRSGGIITSWAGDSILAVFGVWPEPLPPEESAFQACEAAAKCLRAVQRWNYHRLWRGEPPFVTRAGLNTGKIAVGALNGALLPLYARSAVIGECINTAARLEGLGKEFGESAVVISQSTYRALGERREAFELESLGDTLLPGKSNTIIPYRMKPLSGDATRKTIFHT